MCIWQCVTSVAVMSDGRIVSGSEDKTIRVWNMESGESRVMTGHTSVSMKGIYSHG